MHVTPISNDFPTWDVWIYAVHLAFWIAFAVTRRWVRAHDTEPVLPATAAATQTARYSRLILGVHFLAFAILYLAMASALFPDRVPAWFAGQRIAGTVIVLVGAWLTCWALLYLRSWRYRARLDAGHQLATGGPYGWVRHPIYVGLNLLALGTAVWIPTPLAWIAVVLMFLGSDLRGRAEERVLTVAFGEQYRAYLARTRRLIPGLY